MVCLNGATLRRHSLWLWITITFFYIAGMASTGTAQPTLGEAELDHASVERAAQDLEQIVRDAVMAAGGDPEQQRLHFVLAFSTGHFSSDPLRAQASRLTSLELVERMLLRGDAVSSYAFEMDVWDHPRGRNNPFTIPDDFGITAEGLLNLLPMTPRTGSLGGHDTERAVTAIATDLSLGSGPVMIVFTNRAASLSTQEGVQLLGENSPEYQAFLANWLRLDQVNPTGASYELVYDVRLPDGELVTRTSDIVVYVPHAFRAPPLATGTRSERLRDFAAIEPDAVAPASDALAPVPTPDPSEEAEAAPQKLSPFAFILILAVLGVAAFLAWRHFSSVNALPSAVRLNGTRYDLESRDVDDLICEVVGKRYRAEPGAAPALAVPLIDSDEVLARIYMGRNNSLRIENASMELDSADSEPVTAPHSTFIHNETDLDFSGTIVARGSGIPRNVQMRLTVGPGEDTDGYSTAT